MKKLSKFLVLSYIFLGNAFVFAGDDSTLILDRTGTRSLEKSYSELAGFELGIVGLDQLESISDSKVGARQLNSLGSSQYLLGPGDQLSLFLWGESIDVSVIQNQNFPVVQNLKLGSEGEVLIPGLGRFDLRGRNLSEAKELIRLEMSKKYKKFDLSLSLVKPRNQQVWVTGFVKKPGQKEVGPNASVLEALSEAGGPISGGSLRRISVYRPKSDETISVDLYSVLFENGRPLVGLGDGDRVMVEAIGPNAAVVGSVSRPGIYEFKELPNLKEIIGYAGGASAFAGTKVRLIEPSDQGFKIVQASLNDDVSFPSGTLVQVSGLDTELGISNLFGSYAKEYQIVVGGAVKSAGVYTMGSNSKISDAILSAGGYGSGAFPAGLILLRKSVKNAQIYQAAKLIGQLKIRISELEAQLTEAKSSNMPNEIIAQLASKISNAQTYLLELQTLQLDLYGGRISLSAPGTLEGLQIDPNNNLTLEPGDVIIVPQNPTHVLVMGNTYQQNSYPYLPGKRVRDYLEKAGGPNSNGDLSEVYLIKASGEVRSSKSQEPFLWVFRPNPLDEAVGPGDTIIVPERTVLDGSWLGLTKDIMSLTASVLNVALNSVQLANLAK